MAKLVPIQIDADTVLYIEAQETVAPIAEAPVNPTFSDGEEQRRGGAKGLSDFKPTLRPPNPAQSMQMLQSTIRAYSLYCLSAFKNFGSAANVNEVTLEFGINLSADAGIPYIASGKAQSNLKITVKCSYDKPEATQPQSNGQAATPSVSP